MTDDTNNSLIDPSILNVDTSSGADDGIPSFLRRDAHNNAPIFSTQVDENTGQTELTIHEGDHSVVALPDDTPEEVVASVLLATDDAALAVLDQLPGQQPETIDAYADTVDASDLQVTSGSNEGAFIANAPSQMEQAEQIDPHEGDATGPQTSNAPADPEEMRRDFFKDINKFGKASGEGASALGRLGLRALRAAADGVISTAKPQGGGKDDATLIYEAYTAMDSKHSEHTAGGAKANASKLRQIIGMGCMTTISDPVAIGNRMLRIHERMTDADLKPKAVFAALVDVAREQQASDTELTDAAIEDCLTKSKPEKTLEKEWQAIAKKVHDITSGEASHGLKDDSPQALKILELVEEQVKNYAAGGVRQDRIKAVLEMGYSQEQAVAIVDKQLGL